MHQYLSQRHQLNQFKKVYPAFKQPNYPLEINPNPLHLKFQKYFSLFYFIRASSIAFFKPVMNTNCQFCLWIDKEFVNEQSFYSETTFVFLVQHILPVSAMLIN